MKKVLILTLGLLLVSSVCWGKEIKTGTVEMAGAATISYSSAEVEVEGETIDLTNIAVVLDGYYYIIDNLGVGGVLIYDKASLEVLGLEADASLWLIGPQVGYNFSLNEAASLFGAATVGWASAKMEADGLEEDMDGWFWKLTGGLKYFLNDNVSVNGMITYLSATLDNEVEVDISGFSIGAGFSVYLK